MIDQKGADFRSFEWEAYNQFHGAGILATRDNLLVDPLIGEHGFYIEQPLSGLARLRSNDRNRGA